MASLAGLSANMSFILVGRFGWTYHDDGKSAARVPFVSR
jgi:hypothetical protein